MSHKEYKKILDEAETLSKEYVRTCRFTAYERYRQLEIKLTKFFHDKGINVNSEQVVRFMNRILF